MTEPNGVLEKLVVMLGVDVDSSAGKRAESWVHGFRQSMAGLATIAAAAAVGVGKLVVDSARAGDEALATSRKLGVVTETLTELRHAAGAEGVSGGGLEVGLRMFARQVDAARTSAGPARAEFARMGLTLGNLKDLSVDQLFERFSDSIAGIEDPARRAGAAAKLLGRGGSDLLPLLARGSKGIRELRKEARDLGLSISQTDAVAADEFGDTLERLGSIATGVGRRIGFGLIPYVQKIATRMENWWKRNRDWINLKVDQAVYALGEAIEYLNGPLGIAVGLFVLWGSAKTVSGIAALAGQMGPLGAALQGVVGSAGLAAGVIGVGGALYLAFNDLQTAIEGGDSALGRMADAMGVGGPFRESMKDLLKYEEEFGEASDDVWAGFTTGIEDSMSAAMKALGPLGDFLRDSALVLKAMGILGSRKMNKSVAGSTAWWEQFNTDAAGMTGDTKRRHDQYGAAAAIGSWLMPGGYGLGTPSFDDFNRNVYGIVPRNDYAATTIGQAEINVTIAPPTGQTVPAEWEESIRRLLPSAVEEGQRKALDDAAQQSRGGPR